MLDRGIPLLMQNNKTAAL